MCGLNEMLVYASLILIILWIRCRGMSHDPENYANPSVFNPERFLCENPDPDPYSFAFGYGRRCVNRRYLWQRNSKEIWIRACPGMKIADISLFISISMTLATFDICKVKDERGCLIEPDCIYSPGFVRLVIYCWLYTVLNSFIWRLTFVILSATLARSAVRLRPALIKQ